MSAYIGIDPGANGAIAYVSNGGSHDAMAFAKHTPVEWFRFLRFVLQTFSAPDGDPFCMIEKVGAMPKQGVSSTFKFGYQAGMCEAFVIAARIPFEFVTPAKWQGEMRCRTRGDKRVTKRRAEELFAGGLKITHAVADALLIAEYCRRCRCTQRS